MLCWHRLTLTLLFDNLAELNDTFCIFLWIWTICSFIWFSIIYWVSPFNCEFEFLPILTLRLVSSSWNDWFPIDHSLLFWNLVRVFLVYRLNFSLVLLLERLISRFKTLFEHFSCSILSCRTWNRWLSAAICRPELTWWHVLLLLPYWIFPRTPRTFLVAKLPSYFISQVYFYRNFLVWIVQNLLTWWDTRGITFRRIFYWFKSFIERLNYYRTKIYFNFRCCWTCYLLLQYCLFVVWKIQLGCFISMPATLSQVFGLIFLLVKPILWSGMNWVPIIVKNCTDN